MGALKLKTKISVEDYLAKEKLRPFKHEYVEGEVFAMAGTSDYHNLIAGEMYAHLVNHLRNSECLPFFSDIKVRVTKTVYYYPDILVSCEKDPEDPYFRNRPILIIEVTSRTTRRVDRSEKLLYYLQIPDLQEYVIVDQHQMNVEVHRRQPNGGWITYHFNELSDIVEFTSIDFSIPLPDIYRRIQFDKNEVRDE